MSGLRDSHGRGPLVRCPECESPLLVPSHAVMAWDGYGHVVVGRRCPECGHVDRVVTTALAVDVWERREARVADQLGALTDALADGLPIELSEIAAT